MEIIINFPGGAKVDAHFGPYTIQTDQRLADGGEGSAPTPFEVFLASLGTCAGIYILGFCRKRGISTEGIRIVQHSHPNPTTGMVEKVELEIQVPPSFPKEYYNALVHSAELCKVKKTLEQPPQFEIVTKEIEAI
jgi:ribosomal protein S12 methylthiotransferase accessory factor